MANGNEALDPPDAAPVPMATAAALRRRLGFLYLAAIGCATPFVIDITLERPTVGQRFFLLISCFAGAAIYGLARLAGAADAPPRDPLRPWIVLYALALGAAAAMSAEPPFFFRNLTFPLACLALYMLSFAYPWRRESLARLAALLALAIFAVSSIGVAQWFGVELAPYAQQDREGKFVVLSVFGHPNFAASYLAPAMLLIASVSLWAPGRAPGSAARWLAFGCGGAFLILGGTRAAWVAILLAAVAGTVGLVWILGWRPRRPWRLAAAALIAVAAVASVAVFSPLRGYLWRRVSDSPPAAARLYSYSIAIEMIRQRPWIGSGYGSYETQWFDQVVEWQRRPENSIYYPLLIVTRGIPAQRVHNDFLEIAVDAGLTGLFAFFGIGAAALLALWRGARNAADWRDGAALLALVAALLCVAIDGLFGFPLRLPASAALFWILLGALARMATSIRTKTA